MKIGQKVIAKRHKSQKGIEGKLVAINYQHMDPFHWEYVVEHEPYHLYKDKGNVVNKFNYCEPVNV